MKTKTFKIGEYCKGGIITVELQGKIISIIGKEWDYSQGTRRSSNQSNAKEFTRGTWISTEQNCRNRCLEFLWDLTTTYHADKILAWIESKTKINN